MREGREWKARTYKGSRCHLDSALSGRTVCSQSAANMQIKRLLENKPNQTHVDVVLKRDRMWLGKSLASFSASWKSYMASVLRARQDSQRHVFSVDSATVTAFSREKESSRSRPGWRRGGCVWVCAVKGARGVCSIRVWEGGAGYGQRRHSKGLWASSLFVLCQA